MAFGALSYHITEHNDTVIIDYAQLYNLDTEEIIYLSGGINSILERLSTLGVANIFVLNGGLFFSFVDFYATTKKLSIYDTLKDNSGKRKRIAQEAWMYYDGVGASYSRKLWIFSKKTNTRHRRLHTVTFLNFSAMVNVNSVEELADSVNLNYNHYVNMGFEEAKILGYCIKAFNDYYLKITGSAYLLNNHVACWTMGAASRNFYLKLLYPNYTKSRLKAYQIAHPQSEKLEYYFRDCKLLPSGLLYSKDFKKLHTGKFFKYDVNSLFADVERDLPSLGMLTETTFEDYKKGDTEKYLYVFILTYAKFKLREGMPSIFSNPFKPYTQNEKNIEICEEWAIFEPYLNILKKFYIIEDLDIKSVYKAPKTRDIAIKKYVDILYNYKRTARGDNQKGFYKLVKSFIVNLHGKFAQKSVDAPIIFNIQNERVIKTYSDEIINDWTNKHFDFIRGAYIYAMARVKIMEFILRLIEVLPTNEKLIDHIFYDDTDSIITDLVSPSDMIDDLKLGKLKIEETFTAFECIAPKTYWGRTIKGDIKLTCAGMNKDEIFSYLSSLDGIQNHNLRTNEYYHNIFTDPKFLFPVTILTPLKGGSNYRTIYRPIINN